MMNGFSSRKVVRLPAQNLGFTLIELLIVMTVVAILSTLSVGDFGALLRTASQDSVRDKMQSALSLSRAESIRRGHRVVLCAAKNSQCMGTSLRGKHRWETVLVFADVDQDRLYTEGDSLIRQVEFSAGSYVVWNKGHSVIYESDGSLLGGRNGSFFFFHASGVDEGVKLVGQLSGRVRRADFSSSDKSSMAVFLP
ncbi:MAG: GspH/FimT family pseudopilin [Pontibacterium sp.]